MPRSKNKLPFRFYTSSENKAIKRRIRMKQSAKDCAEDLASVLERTPSSIMVRYYQLRKEMGLSKKKENKKTKAPAAASIPKGSSITLQATKVLIEDGKVTIFTT